VARNYAEKDIKLLFALSGGYCAFPNCGAQLVAPATDSDPAVVLGQICHMVASSDDGPRGDAEFPLELRDTYENLLLLCVHHHTLVDKQLNTYSVDDLKQWKAALESYVSTKLAEGMRSIDFAELEIVCRHLVHNNAGIDSTPLTAVDVQDKMDANDLTELVAYRMNLGLMQAPQVAAFLAQYSSMFDAAFPQRLREGFTQLYNKHKSAGLEGDALFIALAEEAAAVAPVKAAPAQRWEFEAASLAVLCHLFELCDLFEAPQ